MERRLEKRGYRNVYGIAWLGIALLTVLCLISYAPTDLPVYTTHPTSTNFIGPIGAHWAALLIFCFGLGAYFFPILALYLGVSLLFRSIPIWRWKVLFGSLLMISVAGILHLQPYFGGEWVTQVNTISPGGFLGHTINSYGLTYLVGRMGAGVVLVLLYGLSLSIFFDLRPRSVMKEMYASIRRKVRRREQERLRKATPKDLLEMRQREITEQMKRLERQLDDQPLDSILESRRNPSARDSVRRLKPQPEFEANKSDRNKEFHGNSVGSALTFSPAGTVHHSVTAFAAKPMSSTTPPVQGRTGAGITHLKDHRDHADHSDHSARYFLESDKDATGRSSSLLAEPPVAQQQLNARATAVASEKIERTVPTFWQPSSSPTDQRKGLEQLSPRTPFGPGAADKQASARAVDEREQRELAADNYNSTFSEMTEEGTHIPSTSLAPEHPDEWQPGNLLENEEESDFHNNDHPLVDFENLEELEDEEPLDEQEDQLESDESLDEKNSTTHANPLPALFQHFDRQGENSKSELYREAGELNARATREQFERSPGLTPTATTSTITDEQHPVITALGTTGQIAEPTPSYIPAPHAALPILHVPVPLLSPAPILSKSPSFSLRPAPLPQSPEVVARRERERDARSAPAVPAVRVPEPGVPLDPNAPLNRPTALLPRDPFEVQPQFEKPPAPITPTAPVEPVVAPLAQTASSEYSATPPRLMATRAHDPAASVVHAGDRAEALTFEGYLLPPLTKLTLTDPSKYLQTNDAELQANANTIVNTLKQFGISTTAGTITRGATITRYELYPAEGVRVDKIVSLRRDIARTMRAERIQILAPIPGKNTVGVEIANTNKVPIVLRDLFESPEWTNNTARIPIALGKDVYGHVLVADLADMPHLLIAGTTGSGKSVCINSILLSLIYRFRPDELRLILVDPKQVEMQVYNTIPHLVVPVVTDPKKVLLALRWVINEMEKRYQILAKVGLRNITAFNNRKPKLAATDEMGASLPPVRPAPPQDDDDDEAEDEIFIPERLPYIVVIIDELADLMQTAPADVESAIARLTAKARASGIHLIVATQTPRREIITGIIKTNIPARIAFQVPSALDSRVILDDAGAENLVGKGDLLYLPPGSSKLTRGQGAFVSDDEVSAVVAWCAAQAPSCFEEDIHKKLSGKGATDEEFDPEDVELIHKCWEVICQEKKASTSMLQRRLRLGYNKAAWVMDFLERILVVGPGEGARPREILVDLDDFELPI